MKLGEERIMLSGTTARELLTSLKGRIAKALTVYRRLPLEEANALEGVCFAIDDFLLFSRNAPKRRVSRFKSLSQFYRPVIEKSENQYVKEHIVPVLQKVSDEEWK